MPDPAPARVSEYCARISPLSSNAGSSTLRVAFRGTVLAVASAPIRRSVRSDADRVEGPIVQRAICPAGRGHARTRSPDVRYRGRAGGLGRGGSALFPSFPDTASCPRSVRVAFGSDLSDDEDGVDERPTTPSGDEPDPSIGRGTRAPWLVTLFGGWRGAVCTTSGPQAPLPCSSSTTRSG
jgi:hypothetical protein